MAAWRGSEQDLAALRQRWEAAPSSHLSMQLAEAYRRQGNLDEAVAVLQRGMAQSTPTLAAEVALGRCLLESGKAEEARAHLQRAVERDPTQMVAYRHLIDANIELGDGEEALRCLSVYRQLNPIDPAIEAMQARASELVSAPAARQEAPLGLFSAALASGTHEAEPSTAPVDGSAASSSEASSRFSAAPATEDRVFDAPPRPPAPQAVPFEELGIVGAATREPEPEEPSNGFETVDIPASAPGNTASFIGTTVSGPEPHFEPTDSSATETSESRRWPRIPFELEKPSTRTYDLAALPRRNLLETQVQVDETIVVSAVPAERLEVPTERLEMSVPVQPTETLGRLYQEQGHEEEAARIQQAVEGFASAAAAATPTPVPTLTPLRLAELVPLKRLRAATDAIARRRLVVRTYLQRIAEARASVS